MGLIEDYIKDFGKEDKPYKVKYSIIRLINTTFLILSIVLIFLIIYIWFNLDNCKLLDTLLYFFSSCAQTMGALVAIVMTAIYVLVQTIKPNNNPASEPVNRILFSDGTLLLAIYLSLAMILLSLCSIIITRVISIEKFKIFVLFSIIIILGLGIAGIYFLLVFLFKRGPLYINPSLLVKTDIYSHLESNSIQRSKIINFNILKDYYEICILMNTFDKGTYFTNQPFRINSKPSIYISDVFFNLIKGNTLNQPPNFPFILASEMILIK